MPRIDIDKLKKLRNAVPLTQPELAEKMGMKRSTYAYKEKIGEFTDTEIQKIIRIFQIEKKDLLELSNELQENKIINGNANGPNNVGPQVDEVVKAKDQTIAALTRSLNFLEAENARLAKQCEVSLAGLNLTAHEVYAAVRSIMESQGLLKAAALTTKIDPKKIDAAEAEVRKQYEAYYKESVESKREQK